MNGKNAALLALVLSTSFFSVVSSELPLVHAAAEAGDMNNLESCLEHSFRNQRRKHRIQLREAKGPYARTPLHYAAYNGRSRAVAYLLQFEQTPLEAQDYDGRTALHLAAFRRAKNCVKKLLDKQANPRATDHEGNTPLHFATEAVIVEMLLQAGANPKQGNVRGVSPLQQMELCAEPNKEEILGLMYNAMRAPEPDRATARAAIKKAAATQKKRSRRAAASAATLICSICQDNCTSGSCTPFECVDRMHAECVHDMLAHGYNQCPCCQAAVNGEWCQFIQHEKTTAELSQAEQDALLAVQLAAQWMEEGPD